jgi:alpha-ketoglutarate-dependent taurine dioxygenase
MTPSLTTDVCRIDTNQNLSFDSMDLTLVENGIKDVGIVQIRGYDLDLLGFEKLTRVFCKEFHMVAARHDFKAKEGDSYSTEVVPYNFTLMSHTEGTFQPLAKGIPDLCFFYCIVPPSEKGGETTLVDGKLFLEHLPSDILDKFLKHGITYEMTWDKKRWQNEFGFETIEELRSYLSSIDNVRYRLDGDSLNLFYTTKAITRSRDGSDVFATGMLAHLPEFNHPNYEGIFVYSNPTNRVYFGNGEEISSEIINMLVDIQDQIQLKHRWQPKDVIIIDNTRFLHGRTSTERDCERRLVSRFGRF